MEKKELSTRQWATIKRTAQNVLPLIEKRKKLEKYVAELEAINAQIEGMEYGTKILTGGYTSEEIVKRVVSDYVDPTTGQVKTDKNGRALKITKYPPIPLNTAEAMPSARQTSRIPPTTSSPRSRRM